MELPQFKTVLRGWDPDQVTGVIKELHTSLVVARRTAADRTVELTATQQRNDELRADLNTAHARVRELEAEQGSEGASFGNLGTRIGSILSLAQEEAAQMRAESERAAAETRQRADAEAARAKAAATASADSVLAAAADEAASRKAAADSELYEQRTRHQERLARAQEEVDRLTADVAARHERAEQDAAQIVAAARTEAARLVEQARAEAADAVEQRDLVHAHLAEVTQLLARLDLELRDENEAVQQAPVAAGRLA